MLFSASASKNEGLVITQKQCLELLQIIDGLCRENNLQYWLDGGTLLGAVRHNGFIPWDDDIDICLPKSDYDKLLVLLKDFCSKSPKHILYFSEPNIPYWSESFGTISYLAEGALPVRIDIIPVKLVENNPASITFDKSLTSIASLYIRGKANHGYDILDLHKAYLPKGRGLEGQKARFFEVFHQYLAESFLKTNPQHCLVNYCFNDSLVKHRRSYFQYNDIFPLSKIIFENCDFFCPCNTTNYLIMLYGENFIQPPEMKHRITHFKLVSENKLPKKEVRYLMDKLYYYGFRNLSLGTKNQKIGQALNFVTSFLKISFLLAFQLKVRSLRNFIVYCFIRL